LLKLVAERLQSQHAPEQVGRIGMNSFITVLPDIRTKSMRELVEEGRKNPSRALRSGRERYPRVGQVRRCMFPQTVRIPKH